MLNLDTHILVFLLKGELTAREQDLVLQEKLAISDIVLWELAKLANSVAWRSISRAVNSNAVSTISR